MAGFDNDVMYASNVDFRGVQPVVAQVTADGQLLIGSSVSPFIRAATLTQGANITITNGQGTIEIAAVGGGDITTVGDVTSGAAFDGTQGTTLTSTSAGFSLLAANNSSGVGGAVSLTGGATSNATSVGGAATLRGGAGNTSGAGGLVTVSGGAAGTTGIGGAVSITTGLGGSTSGRSGALSIKTADANSASGGAGAITIKGGTGSSSGTAGTIAITGGDGATSTLGGAVSLNGGVGGAASAGGAATVLGGSGGGANPGGLVTIQGGTAGTTGNGGGVSITAAAGGSTSGNGGNVTITSGSATSGTTGTVSVNSGLTVDSTGRMTNAAQPAFLAYLASNDSNVTGNGATYTLGTNVALTEIFDQGNNFNTNGTFTAPVTGKYEFLLTPYFTGTTALMTTCVAQIVTTARAYQITEIWYPAAGDRSIQLSSLCNMTAGDTATFTVRIIGGAGNTVALQSGVNPMLTFISGYLVC